MISDRSRCSDGSRSITIKGLLLDCLAHFFVYNKLGRDCDCGGEVDRISVLTFLFSSSSSYFLVQLLLLVLSRGHVCLAVADHDMGLPGYYHLLIRQIRTLGTTIRTVGWLVTLQLQRRARGFMYSTSVCAPSRLSVTYHLSDSIQFNPLQLEYSSIPQNKARARQQLLCCRRHRPSSRPDRRVRETWATYTLTPYK